VPVPLLGDSPNAALPVVACRRANKCRIATELCESTLHPTATRMRIWRKVRVEPKGDIAAKLITQDIRRRPMILNLEEFV
jgi:hypothetical protein